MRLPRRVRNPLGSAILAGAIVAGCARDGDKGAPVNASAQSGGPGGSASQSAGPAPQEMQAIAVAQQGLRALSQLSGIPKSTITDDPAAELDLSLGQGIPVFVVRLDSLKTYQVEQSPERLLTPVQRIAFPVANAGRIKTAVVVERDSAAWHLASLAAFDFGAVADRLATRDAPGAAGNRSLVTIPALEGLSFIAVRDSTGLVLIPLESSPRYELRAGQSVPAAQTFARLAIFARAIDPNVPR